MTLRSAINGAAAGGAGLISMRVGRRGGGGVSSLPPAVLLIVAGQSNARKSNTGALTGPARYANIASPTPVKIWNPVTGAWVDYTTTTVATRTCGSRAGTDGTPDRAWGTEAELIYWMRQAGDNRPVFVVKQAVNGMSIASDWLPPSGGQWTQLKGQTDACLAALRAEYSLTELALWNQGEADANDAPSTTNFAANFDTFMTAFRSSISAGKFVAERLRPLGFGLGAIDNTVDAIARTYTVREAQTARLVADGNAAVISTEWYPTNWTDLHPSQTYADPVSGTVDTWISGLQTPLGSPLTDDGIGKRAYAVMTGTHDATYGSLTDMVPNAFVLNDNAGATASASISSNTVVPAGFGRRTAISITGGEYQIYNWDDSIAVAWGGASGTIDPGQKVAVRVTASATPGNVVSAVLTIGGVSDSFDVTTSVWAPVNTETTNYMDAVAAENGGSNPFTLAEKQAIDAFYTTAKDNGSGNAFLSSVQTMYLGGLNPVAAARVDMIRSGTGGAGYSELSQSGVNGMPSWTDNAGWSNGATSGYGASLNAAPGSLTTQNSIGLGGYFKTRQTSGSSTPDLLDEQATAANVRLHLMVYDAGATTTANMRLNSGSTANITGLGDTDGFYHANRSGASAAQLYGPAGTQIGSHTTASVTPVSTGVYMGRASTGVTTNATLGGMWLTTSLTAGQVQAFRDALVTLLTAFGAN